MFIVYHRRAFVRSAARELGVPVILPNEWSDLCRVRSRHHRFVDSDGQQVAINWGLTNLATLPPRFAQQLANMRVLNRQITCTSKYHTFEVLSAANIPVPPFARTLETLPGSGRFLGRRDGLAHGDGITIYAENDTPTTQHDFFTRVVPKAHELRIHVWRGEVIYAQRKIFPNMAGQELPLIRNYGNGARFSSNVSSIPADLYARGCEIAVNSVTAMGMDFAAVDMALSRRGHWVVFELNSAPHLRRFEDDEIPGDAVSSLDRYMSVWRTMIRS